MQYPHGTTIAVTDGQKLRVFRNTGNEQHLRLLELPSLTCTGITGAAATATIRETQIPTSVACRRTVTPPL